MTITLFGASGHVGQILTKALLDNSYSVIAFVHGKHPFTSHEHLKIVQGDVHNSHDIERALEGSDMVISTLGSWHTPTKDILSSATKLIIPAMEQRGMTRIITLTGMGAHTPDQHLTMMDKIGDTLFSLVARDILIDANTHIDLLYESSLDFTVIRSPVMRSFGAATPAHLSMQMPFGFATVHRQSLVTAIVRLIEENDWTRQAPFISHS